MGKTDDILKVLQYADEPLTCREITARLKLPPEESKNVAATLATYGAKRCRARECRVTNRTVITYSLKKEEPLALEDSDVEQVKADFGIIQNSTIEILEQVVVILKQLQSLSQSKSEEEEKQNDNRAA